MLKTLYLFLGSEIFLFLIDWLITTFLTLKEKQNKLELTDMIDFPSLSLENPPVITSIKYVWYLYDGNSSI